jgi:hypothetical protein
MLWTVFEFLDARNFGVIQIWLKKERIQKEGADSTGSEDRSVEAMRAGSAARNVESGAN